MWEWKGMGHAINATKFPKSTSVLIITHKRHLVPEVLGNFV